MDVGSPLNREHSASSSEVEGGSWIKGTALSLLSCLRIKEPVRQEEGGGGAAEVVSTGLCRAAH